ncbi:unnamed protein product [Moneuplotes crassus]|uniref:Uncharacterized protein n=1 Tax=Euplotes crassus TaxID=5936 RepID=A0AAD1UAM4_EUPCR|nr:unnamed protein product [Moneuplotes crassus]
MNLNLLSPPSGATSSERSQLSFTQHPEKRGDKDQENCHTNFNLDIEEEKVPPLLQEESIHLSELEYSNDQSSLRQEYNATLKSLNSRVKSSQNLFNKTVNIKSKKRLLEIEEKRKKRKMRNAQRHFRGSSFGQGGSSNNIPAPTKQTDCRSNSSFTENNSRNTSIEKFAPPSVGTLKSKINTAVSSKTQNLLNLNDRKIGPAIVSDLIQCVSDVSNEDLLEYIIDIEKEKHKLQTKFSEDYKTMKRQMISTISELDQVKTSYRNLLAKFGGKQIQIRGYKLALNNTNELLNEVIYQIEKCESFENIPIKGFIDSINIKIMKLLESSTKELHTLTDIDPKKSLSECDLNPKDPIEDAFNHLRSLLTFQTALKRSYEYKFNGKQSDLNSMHSFGSSQNFSNLYNPNTNYSENTQDHFNPSEKVLKERKKSEKSLTQNRDSKTSYYQMHSSKSHSREKKKTSTKIYSQLMTGRNSRGYKISTKNLGKKKKSTPRLDCVPKLKMKARRSSPSVHQNRRCIRVIPSKGSYKLLFSYTKIYAILKLS